MTMDVSLPVEAQPLPITSRTVWGLDLIQLHDYYWAARVVEVVRLDDRSTLVAGSELFLLTDHDTLVLFRMRSLVELLSWIAPLVLFGRIHEMRTLSYEEHAISDRQGRLQRFQRLYERHEMIAARVAFTRDADIARAWQAMGATPKPWRTLRRQIPPLQRETTSIRGRIYARSKASDLERFSRDLVRLWRQPAATVTRARRAGPLVWADPEASIGHSARFVDPVWMGAGRVAGDNDLVVGPAILWDDPAKRPVMENIQWRELEPAPEARPPRVRRRSSLSRSLKRLFDIAFSLLILALTLPFYPFVMLAILLEDGRPFFFTHEPRDAGGSRVPVPEVPLHAQGCRADQGPNLATEPSRRTAILHRKRPPAHARGSVDPKNQYRRIAAILQCARRAHVRRGTARPVRIGRTNSARHGARLASACGPASPACGR